MHLLSLRNLFLLLLFSFLTAQISLGQSLSPKNIQAYKIQESEALFLDGRLEEDFWKQIEPAFDFLMQVPVEGGAPSERSEVRIAYDKNNLYIAIYFFDSEPDQIKAFQKKRDASLSTDDRFMWILDTFSDGRNAYYFAINPAGAMQDGLLTIGQGSSLNLNWDGIWRAWTQKRADGWSAEIRIPFRTLNFDPNADRWGINFQRTIRRKNEEILWSGHLRSQGLNRPQNAGTLSGLSEISQGIGLEFVPYAAGRRNQTIRQGELQTEYSSDLGFDVNYNLTPQLKASITYNTDFAETEVDNRQINLTRFPLVFPEKRDFFLEGSSTYSFAAASGVRPYFSRTIGLSGGQTIPIIGGVRLLGNVGKNNIAVQHVRVGIKEQLFHEDFSVARIRRNIGKESRIGLVYTRRTTEDGLANQIPYTVRQTIGADMELNTSTFMGDKNLQFQGFFVYHNPKTIADTNSQFFDRTSRGFRINFPNRPWFAHASYREFGTAFEPALGFHPRVGFRRFQPSVGFNPLIEKSELIRDISYGLRFEHLMDMNWQLLTQEIRFEFFDLTFETADRISFSLSREFERLTSDFDILRNQSIIIPLDDYVNWVVNLELQSASYRRLSARIDLDAGEFWSGTRRQAALAITGRPTPGINVTATYILTDVSLEQGDFQTSLFRLNSSFDFTPFISFASFIQWDNLSKRLGMNNRFQWILSPGNEFFIVYTHNWQELLERYTTENSTATMKLVLTHRF
ncbi:MAG: carbohydrate binding family 9 domain-containing protein [Bacteroidia bacterium]|nr:carbohydrate binding family 9 domain-containing protein [Bacteroidia bacterium]